MSTKLSSTPVRSGATSTTTTPASPAPEPSEWLTTEEAARRYRISRQTLTKLIHTGQIPASRVGAKWILHREEADAALLRHGNLPTGGQHPAT